MAKQLQEELNEGYKGTNCCLHTLGLKKKTGLHFIRQFVSVPDKSPHVTTIISISGAFPYESRNLEPFDEPEAIFQPFPHSSGTLKL